MSVQLKQNRKKFIAVPLEPKTFFNDEGNIPLPTTDSSQLVVSEQKMHYMI